MAAKNLNNFKIISVHSQQILEVEDFWDLLKQILDTMS